MLDALKSECQNADPTFSGRVPKDVLLTMLNHNGVSLDASGEVALREVLRRFTDESG
jgi:hypothetical protein